MIQIESIPAWLRENGRFVLRRGKIPYTRYGRRANPTDAKDGCTAAEALNAWKKAPDRYDGIGVMIIPPLVGIDLDHVISGDGEMASLAEEILGMADTYAEISPSGTGLHLLGLAPGVAADPAKYLQKNSDAGVEVYFSNRYFTFTGDSLADGEVRDISDSVQEVLDTYMKRREMPTEGTSDSDSAADREPDTRTDEEVAMDADAVMDRMKRGKDWETIERLLAGEDIKGNTSDDDMSLMNRLAFYSCRDARVMDYIYRTSYRYREKWDERRGASTWGADQIAKAVRECRTVWNHSYSSGERLAPQMGDAEQDALAWLTEQDAANNSRYSLDDMGAGYLLADWAKPFARYCADANTWFVYRGGVWKKDPGGVAIASKAKVLSAAVASYAASITDDQRRKAWLGFAGRWCSYNSRRTYIRDAASVWPVQRSEFDRYPWLFNVMNGTLDLHKGEFRSHDPADMLTRQGSVVYDPDARCERWESFVQEIFPNDPDTLDFMQRWLGYSLAGDLSEEKMVMLHGESTRNGKSTLCECISAVMGDYATSINPDSLGEQRRSDGTGPSEDIARLNGIRFAVMPEPKNTLRLDAGRIKQLTGGDTVNARFLGENSFTFKSVAHITANANSLPDVNDMTVFWSGRVLVVPFTRHFREWEQDPHLKAKMSTEEARSGILNWMLEGLRKYQQDRLKTSAAMQTALDEYRYESDKLSRFIGDCLPVSEDPGLKIRTEDVYANYQAWCRENGNFAEAKNRFLAGLRNRGVQMERQRPSGGGEKTTVIIGRENRCVLFMDLGA